MYTKPLYCTGVQITSLIVNNERNVNSQNITKECIWTEQTLPKSGNVQGHTFSRDVHGQTISQEQDRDRLLNESGARVSETLEYIRD